MELGRLILCSLPIGNKDDITLNVLKSLKEAEYIYAEDTRSFKAVASDYDINIAGKKIKSFHDQSLGRELNNIIQIIKNKNDVYYFSEAGSPSISDPALPLVRAVYEVGGEVFTKPGACSVISALELSGLPSIPFSFNGFLPREKKKIRDVLGALSSKVGTHVYFESPRRVENLIGLLEEIHQTDIFPSEVCFIREMTKVNQSVIRINKNNFFENKKKITPLGEFVILFNYSKKDSPFVDLVDLKKTCLEVIEKGGGQKSVSKLISKITGESSKSIYQKLISK